MSVTLLVLGETMTFDEVLAHLHRLHKGETLEIGRCIIDGWEDEHINDAAADVYVHDSQITGTGSGIDLDVTRDRRLV